MKEWPDLSTVSDESLLVHYVFASMANYGDGHEKAKEYLSWLRAELEKRGLIEALIKATEVKAV